MPNLAGPYLAVVLLLLASGVRRLRRPGATVRLLRSAGLPAGPAAAHALGSAELGVAVGAVTVGGPRFAALAALAYLVRAVATAWLTQTDRAAGSSRGRRLVGGAASLAAASIAAAAAVTGVPALPQTAEAGGRLVLPSLVLTLAAAWWLRRAGAGGAGTRPAAPAAAEDHAPDGPWGQEGPVAAEGCGAPGGCRDPGRGRRSVAGRHAAGRARRL